MTKREMPDFGFKRSEFDDAHNFTRGKELYADIRAMGDRIIMLPLMRNQTQREEMLRSYMFLLRSRDISKLPYWPGGIGSREQSTFKALMAEVSCMVCAYWDWLNDPTDPNLEALQDHMYYLDQVCRDPDTLCYVELPHGHGKSGSCRYRISNARIKAGFKLPEH